MIVKDLVGYPMKVLMNGCELHFKPIGFVPANSWLDGQIAIENCEPNGIIELGSGVYFYGALTYWLTSPVVSFDVLDNQDISFKTWNSQYLITNGTI